MQGWLTIPRIKGLHGHMRHRLEADEAHRPFAAPAIEQAQAVAFLHTQNAYGMMGGFFRQIDTGAGAEGFG